MDALDLFVASWWSLLLLPFMVVCYGMFNYLLDKIKYRHLPPGPMPLPFIGSMWVLAVQPKKQSLSTTMRKMAEKYGPVFTFYFGPMRMIAIDDAKIAYETLVTQGNIFKWRFERRMPGFENIPDGIILANNDPWRRHRRFGLKAMRDLGMGKAVMATKVQHETSYLVANFDEKAKINGKSAFNPRRLIANAVSNVICSLVFGHRFDDPNDPTFADLLARVDRIASTTTAESAAYLIFPFMRHFRTPAQPKEYSSLAAVITKMLVTIVEEHRADFDEENIRDFPDLFIQAEKQQDALDLNELGDITTDMFMAGMETTATALTWTLLYLTKYPEIQQKCHNAIDAVIDTDRLPSLADRPRLVYLDAVMHEILRDCAIVPLALFHSNLDTPAVIGGNYDVPPSTIIMYNVASIHHDPTYWKDPNQFNPDRWIDEKTGELLSHSSHFVAFGLGPRICLGEQLARVEFFIFLVALLHRFRFELDTDKVADANGHEGTVNSCPSYKIIAKNR